MVQGYYTLQEAADVLDMSVDELKQMAQKGRIRSFQDRGTLRFRIQDIQELGRSRGTTSDPDLVLGDASLTPPKSAQTPSSGKRKAPVSPKSPAKKDTPEVFAFDLDDSVDLGSDVVLPKSGVKSKPVPKSSRRPASPVPSAGSDSDVRLVADGSDVTFSLAKDSGGRKIPDSDVKISPDPLKPKTSVHPPSSGAKRKSQLATESGSNTKPTTPKPGSGQMPIDSGVRLVPLSDSDVKLLGSSDDVPLGGDGSPAGATDSNVRLEKVKIPPADSGEGMMLTEEINLDEEIRKHQEKDKAASKQTSKLKPKSELKFPTSSPFELSDSDLEMPPELKSKAGPRTPKQPSKSQQDSSDFELEAHSPADDGSSDFDLLPAEPGGVQLEGDSADFSLELSDSADQVLEADHDTELTSASSGISLDNPVDQGISLEGGESDDFDLSLEVEDTPRPSLSQPAADSESDFEIGLHKTPKPSKHQSVEDSASDFDLSLESDLAVPSAQDDSSFDLNLDGSGESGGLDSDSEFELTLDDSGNLALEEEAPAPQVKAKKGKKPAGDEDIFETDFEVPALDGSDEATVADSELESSDFDLALDDSELAQEEESGSQVVALDEEDAETLVDGDAVVDDVEVDEESSDFADLDQDVEVEGEDGEPVTQGRGKVRVETVVQEKLIEPAPWGVLPVIFMLPCVIAMFFVAILGYETLQTTAQLKPPGPVTAAVAGLFDMKLNAR